MDIFKHFNAFVFLLFISGVQSTHCGISPTITDTHKICMSGISTDILLPTELKSLIVNVDFWDWDILKMFWLLSLQNFHRLNFIKGLASVQDLYVPKAKLST